MPGTALQGRAFTTATNDDTFRALSVEISLTASSEGRVGVCPVAQKTVTNADIIALDYVCFGALTTVAALVIKMDPPEKTTNPRLLLNSIRCLLDGSTGKVGKPGLVQFTIFDHGGWEYGAQPEKQHTEQQRRGQQAY